MLTTLPQYSHKKGPQIGGLDYLVKISIQSRIQSCRGRSHRQRKEQRLR
jgi:hypothetical protein